MRFKNNVENVVEFINGNNTASVTFNSKKYINKIRKLHDADPEEFTNYMENSDGSIFATIPLSWVKISRPRKMSDEQKQAASDRLRKIKEKIE